MQHKDITRYLIDIAHTFLVFQNLTESYKNDTSKLRQ